MKVNKGLQPQTVIESTYYKTLHGLFARLKSLAYFARSFSTILFFMMFILLMVRMFMLFIDVFYESYRYQNYDIWVILNITYSIFFFFWAIDVFWFNYIMKHISFKRLTLNLMFKIVFK